MLPLYSLIYALALLFIFPFELKKRPANARKDWLRDKFGAINLPRSYEGKEKSPLMWVHAVSVGEVIAASQFIRAFKKRHPEYNVVISTITDTGQNVAMESLKGVAEPFYLPFDLKWVLRKAIRRLAPSIFVNMETELWPNLLVALKSEGVPVVLMNGRISEKSFKNYMKVKGFMKKLLEGTDLICMQHEEYAGRIIAMGADKNKVIITGSLKFDVKVNNEAMPWTSSLKRPAIIAGSTHSGEEELIVSSYVELLGKYRDLNLVVAPRHPQRFEEVEGMLKGRNVTYVKRSTLSDLSSNDIRGTVVLLDTVGELSAVYGACDIAIMGGSFIDHGGQNPLEPAYWGVPAICGPYMFNFPFISDFYRENAAVKVDETTLTRALDDLLSYPEKRETMGKRAREMLIRNQGALEKALDAMEQFVRGG